MSGYRRQINGTVAATGRVALGDLRTDFYNLPGRIADFDPSDLTTVTKDGGNLVSSFASNTGSNVLSQATGSLQPVWSATGINGTPAILFDGIDDVLAGAAGLASTLSGSTAYTLICVAKRSTDTTPDTIFSAGTAVSSGSFIRHGILDTDSDYNDRDQAGLYTANNGSTAAVFAGQSFSFVAKYTGSAISTWVNTQPSVVGGANTRAPVVDTCVLGALLFTGVKTEFFAGYIGRFAVFGSLTETQRNTAESYIRSVSGL